MGSFSYERERGATSAAQELVQTAAATVDPHFKGGSIKYLAVAAGVYEAINMRFALSRLSTVPAVSTD